MLRPSPNHGTQRLPNDNDDDDDDDYQSCIIVCALYVPARESVCESMHVFSQARMSLLAECSHIGLCLRLQSL